MKSNQTEVSSTQAMIQQLVKQNLAVVAKLNSLGKWCFCCVGCGCPAGS